MTKTKSNDERIVDLMDRYLEKEKGIMAMVDIETNGNFSILVNRMKQDEDFRTAFLVMMLAILRDNPPMTIDVMMQVL